MQQTARDEVLGDPDRLAALHATGMLDTTPDESIDRFTRLAQRMLRTPLAQLSLVDDHRQVPKSRIGPLGDGRPAETPLARSICQHVVATGEPLAVRDLREHPELRDSLAVTEDGVVAYAGVPVARRGQVIGAFCVVDEHPRDWSEEDTQLLRELGAAVATEIELRVELADRARIDAELAIANRRLRDLVEHSPALVYLKDLEGHYLLVNQRFADQLGLPEAQVVGARDTDLVDERTAEIIQREERRVLETGGLVQQHHALERPDGTQYLQTMKFPLRDDSGEIYALCGIATDETGRVEDERRLRDTQERLRSAFDNAPIGMAMICADGVFLRVNPALCELVARPEAELLRMRIYDVVHPDDTATDLPEVERLLAGDIASMQSDTRFVRPDGTCRNVMLTSTAIGDGDGPPAEISLQLQDVTDRVRAQRQLDLRHRAARALFESDDVVAAAPEALAAMAELIDAGEAALWLTSDDGELRRIASSRPGNAPTAESETARPMRERALREASAVTGPASACIPIQPRRASTPVGVVEFLQTDGPPSHDVLDHLSALAGKIALLVERRRHEVELARARDAALEASRMKSTFLANMSHEIRTPMNGVIGMTDLLTGSELSEEQRRWVAALRTSGRALLSIIDDILDFSKVEAGKIELERVPFDLHDVVDAVCEILGEQAGEKGLALDAFVERKVPARVWGDPARLQQILTNLMANAVKFTERGGVTLRVSVARDDSGEVRFEVIDTGIGIEPELIQRLFEPFSQADSSTTRRYGGTGLGLSISRQLVELMGGVIGATSVPGEGTTFYVTLPLGRAGDAAGAIRRPDRRDTPTAEIPPNGRSVLVVDDNPVNQTVAAELLRRAGYDVALAADGREAVAATRERRFDAVLMDCQMPVMDGLDATREIRAREARDGGHVPIIALTSGSTSDDRDDALAAGMDAFLAKPVTAEALAAAVDRSMRGRARDDAPAGGEDAPALDTEVFGAIAATGDGGLAEELARLFARESRGAVAALRAALADGEAEDVARAAHGLKGSASTLGAATVASLAADLERAGRDGRLDDAGALLERLVPAVDAAAEALSAAAARNGSG